MKKITTLLFAFITFLSCYSQVEVYKTLKDFQNNTPEKYTSTIIKFYPDYRSFGKYKPTLEFKEDGKKVKIMLTDVWAFKYKGILFRTITTMGNITVGLLSDGKICYWENAVFIFKKIDHAIPGLSDADYGDAAYLSANVESDIIKGENFKVFLNSNTEYKKLIDIVEARFKESSKSYEKEQKTLKKIQKVAGNNVIGIMDYLSFSNYDKELNILRSCIKEYNGNFSSQIALDKN